MRPTKLLLLLPVAAALGGCLSYGDPVYTYSQPAYTYSAPAYTYSAPAIVAPPGSYYYYGPSYSTSRFDRDGDGVSNSMDRYPYDARRW